MAAYDLSRGALSTILSGGNVESPILQILGVRKMSGNGSSARHRILISDGINVNSFAILAIQLNQKIANGELEEYTVIQVTRYLSTSVGNDAKQRIMILLDLNVIAPGAEVGQRIGSPQPLSVGSQLSATSSAAAAEAPVAARPALVAPAARLPVPQGGIPPWVAARIPPPIGRQSGELSTQNVEANSPMNPQPIPSLIPYTNTWCIKGRVTNKSSIRSWSKDSGSAGKLFSFDIMDRYGEIRITAFKELCDKLYDVIEVGNVYTIFRGIVKPANRQFSSLKNDFEVTLYNHSQVIPNLEDSPDIPRAKFNFEPLSVISRKNANDYVDIIGICRNVGELVAFRSKTSNKEVKKREITLVDKSLASVALTLWGMVAEEFNGDQEPVIVVRGGIVNEFRGAKSVSAPSSTTILTNPDIQEAHRLRGWYDNHGKTINFKNLSLGSAAPAKCVSLAEVNETTSNATFYHCKGTLVLIKSDNAMYTACPSGNCNKKVMNLNNGMFYCSKCDQNFYECSPRFLLSMGIADHSAHQWVTCFHEVAEEILGHPAAELNDLKDENPEAYQHVFEKAIFTSYVFRLRAQMQTYNDEQRLKVTVISAKPVDHAAYAKDMLKEMEELYGTV